MALANVALTDTFDTWRVRTNQMIIQLGQANGAISNVALSYAASNAALDKANTAYDRANTSLSNTSGISFNGNLNFPTGNVGIGTASPSQKLHVVGSGFASTDFRAPIFRDSADITYYLDPNGTSNLYGVDAVNSVKVGDTGQFNITLVSNQINTGYNYAGLSSLNLNYNSYQGLGTQFRNTEIYNGKQQLITKFNGTDKSVNCYGNVTISTGLSVNNKFIVDGTGVSVLGQTLYSTGALFVENPSDYTYSTYVQFNQVNSGYNHNGIAPLAFNYVGYLAGTTQFRNTEIFNGKNQLIALFKGSDKSVNCYGNVVVTSGLSSASLNVNNKFFVTSSGVSLYGQTLYTTGALFVENASDNRFSVYVQDNQVNSGYSNSSASLFINYVGYLGGTTQFRDTYICDGKASVATYFSASDKSIYCYGNITAFYSSDIKLKTNIVNIANPIEKIKQINGVEFDWTDDYLKNIGTKDEYFNRKHDVGVIAQEVEKVLPEVVATRKDGIKAVKYDRIIPLLIEAIKEQQKQIDELNKKIEG